MKLRFQRSIVASLAFCLAGCGTEPRIADAGPRVAASLAGQWRLGQSPGRQTRFSADSKLLASSTAAGDVTIQRTSDWKPVRRVKHAGGATSLAFSPGGRLLFTAGYDGRVQVWDLQTGKAIIGSQVASGTIWSVDISPDGRWLAASGEDKVVHLIPLGQKLAHSQNLQGHERNIWEVRFSPSAKELASGSFDQTARIWALNGRPRPILRGHTQAVVSVAYSPDGQRLATSGDDSTIRLWRTADTANVRTIHADNHVYKIEFSPDGRWLASAVRARSAIGTFWYQLTGSGSAASPLRIWRAHDGALVAALPHPTDVFSLAYSPDGRLIATTDEDGTLRVWKIS
jgi:WD40 repeat protein